ncbi:Uncharacterised protein [Myroides odoratus]|uniref:Uncharacterized protein n=2 Tax=Myroides odoratus TaxID=256 RepID=A0A9Q6Z880_MYROD|nr:hypothetical protein Myrod_1612 [Myroides odoratus DSM 2801]EKB07993.1 hypothetical protein HMPREF9716_01466 [Myroides odoratus CIP 103059]QQT99817.1 hypothetical protein I6I88_16895 [Myroides odoratus]STZ29706.1 Uncharacterised protein [Myroides odoratus]
MFRKVKFFLVCAMIAISASACSSDDSSTSTKTSGTGYRVSNEEYVVEVAGTRDVEFQRIEVATIEGKEVSTFIKDEFGGKREWTKDFKKTVKQKITVMVFASSENEESKLQIRVKKSQNIIKEAEFVVKGKSLYGEVIF